jgi:hypothetical protein
VIGTLVAKTKGACLIIDNQNMPDNNNDLFPTSCSDYLYFIIPRNQGGDISLKPLTTLTFY